MTMNREPYTAPAPLEAIHLYADSDGGFAISKVEFVSDTDAPIQFSPKLLLRVANRLRAMAAIIREQDE